MTDRISSRAVVSILRPRRAFPCLHWSPCRVLLLHQARVQSVYDGPDSQFEHLVRITSFAKQQASVGQATESRRIRCIDLPQEYLFGDEPNDQCTADTCCRCRSFQIEPALQP